MITSAVNSASAKFMVTPKRKGPGFEPDPSSTFAWLVETTPYDLGGGFDGVGFALSWESTGRCNARLACKLFGSISEPFAAFLVVHV